MFALTFVVCLFAVSAVSYADGNEEGQEENDAWKGEYKEFRSENGAVTQVFENGSVRTNYPDGSREGVDYGGNRYTEDKDGKMTAYYTDGSIGTKYADGKEEYKYPDGTREIYNTDGTIVSIAETGLCTEFDKDGKPKYCYFESGGKKAELDENGDLPSGSGEIKGKNGETLTWTNKEKDGSTEYSMKINGNGLSSSMEMKFNDDGSGSINIERHDGLTVNSLFDAEGNTTGFVKKGSFSAKIDLNGDGSGTMSNSAGDKTVIDRRGNVTIKTADGLSAKFNLNSSAIEYYDKSSGCELVVNEDGEVVKYKNYTSDGSSMVYEDGNLNIKNADGSFVRSTKNEDGSTTVTTSDGDKYVIDSDGKIYKNGALVKDGDDPSDTSSPQGNNPGSTQTSAEEQMRSNKSKLESLGYRVDLYTTGISDYELSIGAKKGTLKGYLYAIKTSSDSDDSSLIQIYYFDTEANAAACNSKYGRGKLVGHAIVRGDDKGVIS